MVQLGQYGAPQVTIAHFSDPHLLAGAAGMFDGAVDSTGHLVAALQQLEAAELHPDAIVFTGDLADLGEEEAYVRLRSEVEPVAERLGAQLIWVMGNHDERAPYARVLFDEDVQGDASTGVAPQDRVYEVKGLRIVALDSSVPGYHHGELEPAQLEWLREVLATPAPRGTLIALHHPPIPMPLDEAMAPLELADQPAFAAAIEGSDVRAILAGHLHYSSHSTFAGVPVSVASATCYTGALGLRGRVLVGFDRFQSVDTVHVYDDQIVHTTVPLGDSPWLGGIPEEVLAGIEPLPLAVQREIYSRKNAPWGPRLAAGESLEAVAAEISAALSV